MRRRIASLVVIYCLLASVTAIAQTPRYTVDLAPLHFGPVNTLKPVELDGRPGSEFLVRASFFTFDFTVINRQYAGGLCNAGIVRLLGDDELVDVDGDGIVEIMRLDRTAQTVTVLDFPTCPPPVQ